MKKYDNRRSAITYGIGHGGFEALYIILQTSITFIVLGIMVNTGNLDKITASMDEASKAAAMEQIALYSQQTFFKDALALIERVSAIVFHISLIRRMMAVFLHFAMDFMALIYVKEIVSPIIYELIFTAATATIAVFTYRFYKTLPQEVGDIERRMERNGRPDKALYHDNASEA